MAFREYPHAWGRVKLRTWDLYADERLQRLVEREGMLHEAIEALMSEGFRPRQQCLKGNMVVDNGFNLLLQLLSGTAGAGLQYVALGSSSTAPIGSDTQLGTEIIRIQVSSFSQATNDLTVTGYFDPTQANVSLSEAAIFGGNATSAANSGEMYSMVTYSAFTKSNLESLTAQWDLGFARP